MMASWKKQTFDFCLLYDEIRFIVISMTHVLFILEKYNIKCMKTHTEFIHIHNDHFAVIEKNRFLNLLEQLHTVCIYNQTTKKTSAHIFFPTLFNISSSYKLVYLSTFNTLDYRHTKTVIITTSLTQYKKL